MMLGFSVLWISAVIVDVLHSKLVRNHFSFFECHVIANDCTDHWLALSEELAVSKEIQEFCQD